MLKPDKIVEWALLTAQESNLGKLNKIEPSASLKDNGTLDGVVALNHYNWMLNLCGLWQNFMSDMVKISDGNGAGLSLDNHSCLIFAHNKTNPAQYIFGSGFKNGASAPIVSAISSATLGFGTSLIDGTIPITGATASNINVLSLNFIRT